MQFETDIAGFFEKQLEALDIMAKGKTKYFLYGGAMGPGKSRFLRWFAPWFLMGMQKKKELLGCELC